MNGVGSLITGPLLIAIPVAILAGLVSFASPCILPLVPGYLAYVGGFTDGRSAAAKDDKRGRNRLVLGVALFVIGFAVVFVIGGFLLGAVGFWLIEWRDLLTRIAGVIVILLGLVFVGQFTFLQRTFKPSWRPAMGLAGAPILGVVFAIGWSPCTGPTLVAISGLSLSGGSPWQGALLALFYALGLGVPFLLIALGFGWASGGIAFLRRHIRAVNIIGGVLLIVIGLLMVSGVWNYWIIQLQGVLPDFRPAI
ncbi:cytochrome c biogenesis CcdA family protein [Rathayibacter soli]|uniref:cytochrome c biogenesis CcdA family protein n=1 Tax=Rathayibacter soli TaxID=3144168 RepID=UPI0027E3D12A|nr:cytochrome c biogenesis protein CcdA [Glaciibacter superstes]